MVLEDCPTVWEGSLGEVAWTARRFIVPHPKLDGRVIWACLVVEDNIAAILSPHPSEAGVWASEFNQDLVGRYVIEIGREIWQFNSGGEFVDRLKAEVLQRARVGDLIVTAKLNSPKFVSVGWIAGITPERLALDRAFGVLRDVVNDVELFQILHPERHEELQLVEVKKDVSDEFGDGVIWIEPDVDIIAIVREPDVFDRLERAVKIARSIWTQEVTKP